MAQLLLYLMLPMFGIGFVITLLLIADQFLMRALGRLILNHV